MPRVTRLVVLIATIVGALVPIAGTALADACPGGRLPDLQTVVPRHLGLVNPQGREVLRFSNGIANTGEGPWRLRPEFPAADPSEPQLAIQEVLDSADSSGAVVCEAPVSVFAFHPEHNHWHIDDVAIFEIRVGAPDGPVLQNDRGDVVSVKTTFCLIDWIRLAGNTNSGAKSDRAYEECNAGYQGISVGWVDQYHHATDGQQLDLTGAPAGEYFLVSTANAAGSFLETDTTNNTAWQGFTLTRKNGGNPKLTLTTRSPCEGALCGDGFPNR